MTVTIETLVQKIRDAAKFNPDIQVAPACILWPDRDRQWEAVIPRLQAEIPELLVLGDYQPNKRTGTCHLVTLCAGGEQGWYPFATRLPSYYLLAGCQQAGSAGCRELP